MKHLPFISICILIAALLLFTGTASADTPTAAFSGAPTSGIVPLTVTFTDASTVLPAGGWAWFFGDETYTQAWTQQNASSGWSKRSAQSTVVMQDGTIVLMGGGYGSSYFNDTWRSTDSGVTWTMVNASSGWSNRSAHSSVAMPDGSIVLMGGYDGSYKNDTWKSTDKGTTWTLVNESSGWSKRNGQTCVAMPDGTIVLMGGWDGSIGWNDTWKSTDDGITWTLVNASSGWSERSELLSVVMPDGSIVLIWGISDHIGMYDTWRSTDAGATWTEISAASMPERPYAGSVAMPDGSILIMGGDGPSSYNDMWRSTNFGATWTLVNADCGWSARTRIHSVAMPDGSIVLVGGRNLNDTWRFQPTGSSIQNPSHTYTIPGTYQVALQVYNTEVYNSTRKTGYITVSPVPLVPNGGSDGVSNGGSDGGPEVGFKGGLPPVQDPGMPTTLDVNVGGDSAVTQVVVTGTGISDIIVTGRVVSGPGNGVSSPPGLVYEFVEISPARYGTITGAQIFFTVPQQWLEANQLPPQDVVLEHNVGSGWEPLTTTFVGSGNGHAYFSGETPGFSRFAITGQPGISPGTSETTLSTTPQTFGDLQPASGAGSPITTAPPVASEPVVVQTTAIPAPQPTPAFPVAALVIIAGIVLAGSGFLIRRWWIRKQNPALFREYD